ncbi:MULTISPECIES: hypothetical protein [unclassified Paenibacillus]|uniref:hypothetical protein n=1 Tax=unclassified Paenibacillus TaxID=185978 RepID=UPI0006761F78|nr:MULTISPECIES: hypothetical protein [unclassified Paenibacillus]SFR19521.1 hypothetical protein SAMN04488603_105131 [Paenibacillus sp. cl130]
MICRLVICIYIIDYEKGMYVAVATFYQAFKLKSRIWRTMLKRNGVTGIGVGYADPNRPAKGAAIVLYTLRNLSAVTQTKLQAVTKDISRASAIPIRILGAGSFKMEAAAPTQTNPRQRWRPVPGAVSVGTTVPTTAGGTGGLIVIKNNTLFILSNAHVLVPTNTNQFHNTIQPSPADGGRTADQIGRAFQFVPLTTTGVNFQDSAIAIANSNSLLNPRYLINQSGGLITVPGHLLSYRLGMTFKRMAKTNGFARGVVEAIGVEQRVRGDSGIKIFRDQTVIRFTQGRTGPGDSGSVWLNDSNDRLNNYAAAVHFAGSTDGTRSVSFPIERAMRTYGTLVAVPAGAGRYKAGVTKGKAPKNNYAYVRPMTRKQLALSPIIKSDAD